GGGRRVHVLLEILGAMTAAVFVDRHALLAPSLYVALHEFLGVLFEDVVDLVEKLVDVLLDLLALLGDLGVGRCAVAVVRRLARSGLFPFLLSHHILPSTAGSRTPSPAVNSN